MKCIERIIKVKWVVLVVCLVAFWVTQLDAVQQCGSGSSNPNVFGDATNYAEFTSDGELILHGTARTTRHLRVQAENWTHGVSAPTKGIDGVYVYQEFDNASDDEAHYTLVVPARWDSTTDMEFAVDWYYTGDNDAGTVCWALEYKAIKAGEAVTGVGTTIAKTSTGSHTSGNLVTTTFITKVLASALEEYDIVGLRFYRDVDGGGDSGDSMTANIRMVNAHFHYTQSKLGKTL